MSSPSKESEEDEVTAAPTLQLLLQAKENPFQFFTQGEIAELFGFSRQAVSALVNHGAPSISRKINPHLFYRWIETHPDVVAQLGKISDEAKKGRK